MPTIQELTAMVEQAGGDPQKLSDAFKQAVSELGGAQDALHRVNQEAAERRKKLEAYEKAEQERAEANRTELEKASAKAAELEKKLGEQSETFRRQTIRHAVEMAALKMGFADANDAYTLADLSSVEIADDGKVAGVEKALEALLVKKPYLKTGQQKPPDLSANERNNVTSKPTDDILARKRAEYQPL